MAETESEAPKKPISIYEILTILVEQMASVSMQKLGLQRDPVTGTLEMNLPEAKVAIDVTAQLAQHLDSQVDDEDRRQLHNLVRDLKVNYVNKSQGASN
jgi:hypothetical protein